MNEIRTRYLPIRKHTRYISSRLKLSPYSGSYYWLIWITLPHTPLPVSRWIGERTIQLLWRECELLLLRQVYFDGLNVASCGSDGLSVASRGFDGLLCYVMHARLLWVSLVVDRWRHVCSAKVALLQSSARVTNEGD
ncbi:hypothetical protein TNCV_781181 [Trichonephila clavipes]|nr:hypothetical protein TNCV_781181 [Trichonephila clavipes]